MGYRSKTIPTLSFFVEPADKFFFQIMSKVDGFPAREAWPEWKADSKGANFIARSLADGSIPFEHRCGRLRNEGCEYCQAELNAFINNSKNEVQHAN